MGNFGRPGAGEPVAEMVRLTKLHSRMGKCGRGWRAIAFGTEADRLPGPLRFLGTLNVLGAPLYEPAPVQTWLGLFLAPACFANHSKSGCRSFLSSLVLE